MLKKMLRIAVFIVIVSGQLSEGVKGIVFVNGGKKDRNFRLKALVDDGENKISGGSGLGLIEKVKPTVKTIVKGKLPIKGKVKEKSSTKAIIKAKLPIKGKGKGKVKEKSPTNAITKKKSPTNPKSSTKTKIKAKPLTKSTTPPPSPPPKSTTTTTTNPTTPTTITSSTSSPTSSKDYNQKTSTTKQEVLPVTKDSVLPNNKINLKVKTNMTSKKYVQNKVVSSIFKVVMREQKKHSNAIKNYKGVDMQDFINSQLKGDSMKGNGQQKYCDTDENCWTNVRKIVKKYFEGKKKKNKKNKKTVIDVSYRT